MVKVEVFVERVTVVEVKEVLVPLKRVVSSLVLIKLKREF